MVGHRDKLVHAPRATAPGAGFTTMETDMSKFSAVTQLLPRRALLGLAACAALASAALSLIHI